MNAEVERMAHDFFGYGRWDAPYWFIGPEQGGGENESRAAIFDELQQDKAAPDGLCDCRDFHGGIQELRWHFIEPVDLQFTWRKLMLLLMTYLSRPTDIESMREYQRCRWGRQCGETCVIDLSGLSFGSFRESSSFRKEVSDGVAADLRELVTKRANFVCAKIREVRPSLIVFYGYSYQRYWTKIAGDDLPERNEAKKTAGGVVVYAQHPAAYGKGIDSSDLHWCKLGRMARQAMEGRKR